MSTLKNSTFDNGVGRSKEQTDQLRRIYRDMEVVDAKAKMIITVKAIDGELATAFDASACVFARACQRLFDSQAAVFFSRTVYVDLIDEDDVRKVFRFTASERTYAAIKEYDSTGNFRIGTFTLNPPPPSKELETQRQKSAAIRHRPGEMEKRSVGEKRRKARIKSEAHVVKSVRKAGIQTDLGRIRSGNGLVHTTIVR